MASSTSSQKRARTNTPPSASIVGVDVFAEKFNDPTADVLLRTWDGRLFGCHNYVLSASSKVFRDMLALPQPGGVSIKPRMPDQAAPEDLPIVQLSDEGQPLDAFLQWLYPGPLRRLLADAHQGTLIKPDINLYWTLVLADKYEALSVQKEALRLFEAIADRGPPNGLAIAVLTRNEDAIRSALRAWLSYRFEIRGKIAYDLTSGDMEWAFRSYDVDLVLKASKRWTDQSQDIASISSIQTALLALLPAGCLVHLDIALKAMTHQTEFDPATTLERFVDAFRQGFPLACEILKHSQAFPCTWSDLQLTAVCLFGAFARARTVFQPVLLFMHFLYFLPSISQTCRV